MRTRLKTGKRSHFARIAYALFTMVVTTTIFRLPLLSFYFYNISKGSVAANLHNIVFDDVIGNQSIKL